MPDVELIFLRKDQKVRGWITNCGRKLQVNVAKITGYETRDVSIRPTWLDTGQANMSVNLPALQIRIHTGDKTAGLDDTFAADAANTLMATCKGLREINYDLWIWNTNGNGYYKHSIKS